MTSHFPRAAGGWGALCIAGGTISHSIEPSADVISLPIIVGGAVLGSYPLFEMVLRGNEARTTALLVTPTGVQLNGRF